MSNATAEPTQRISANEIVASNIRAELARIGSKPADLARVIGEGEMWLSRRLSSKVAFSTNEVQTIADALGVSPGELFIAHERRTPRPGLGAGRRSLYLVDGRTAGNDGEITAVEAPLAPVTDLFTREKVSDCDGEIVYA